MLNSRVGTIVSKKGYLILLVATIVLGIQLKNAREGALLFEEAPLEAELEE